MNIKNTVKKNLVIGVMLGLVFSLATVVKTFALGNEDIDSTDNSIDAASSNGKDTERERTLESHGIKYKLLRGENRVQILGLAPNANANIYTAPWSKIMYHDDYNFTRFGLMNRQLNCQESIGLVIPKRIDGKIVTSISEGAFANQKFKWVIFQGIIDEIQENAFLNCIELDMVYFLKGVCKIKDFAFRGCANLGTARIKNDSLFIAKEISPMAFEGCNKLGKIDKSDELLQEELVKFPAKEPHEYYEFIDCSKEKSELLKNIIPSIKNAIIKDDADKLQKIIFNNQGTIDINLLVNPRDGIHSSLMDNYIAAKHCFFDNLKLQGLDIYNNQQYATSLIGYSALCGSLKCFKYLKVNGADIGAQPDYLSSESAYVCKPMTTAILGGNIEIIRILSQDGAFEFPNAADALYAVAGSVFGTSKNGMSIVRWLQEGEYNSFANSNFLDISEIEYFVLRHSDKRQGYWKQDEPNKLRFFPIVDKKIMSEIEEIFDDIKNLY